ncbi:MAG TPA: endopeptidase La [Thermoanaerobaculia bacterium]|jgi:ATP-dependent Lon protease|nr:endopeptidase La [Thermoanaerobaculia bacterium]
MTEANETAKEEAIKIPDVLPVLPLKDLVIFPFIIVPLSVSREKSINAVDQALAENRVIMLTAQKDFQNEDPAEDDLYRVGTVAIIMRMLKLPDGRIRILVQGLSRARIDYFIQTAPFFKAKITRIEETTTKDRGLETEALIRAVKQNLDRAVGLGKNISPEVMVIAANLDDPARLTDLAASNLDLKLEEAQQILETMDPVERLKRVNDLLSREINLLTMQQEISSAAQGEMNKSQREYFLRQQLKAIQSELGEGEDVAEDVENYRKKIEEKQIPSEAREEVEKQIKRLERSHPDSAETSIIRTYLDWMTGLPWGVMSADNHDLERARKILDEDHYDLEKIKERILEYLAVRKLRGQKMKGPILCFVGPPGVGKTSLGRSIARALDRKFVRISLGGVRDEAEVRGHRRTYVGALPGRIVQGINQAATSNPVFMLDEVDKIGADYRGDPSSALLEVLDPEQNFSFRDHYLGVPYDLSNVMFIVTANVLDTIQPAFLDRMEVIRLSGYTDEEKLSIAKQHLIPKQMEENGIKETPVVWTDSGIMRVITGYTKEAGLRNLEREIGTICRKIAVQVAGGNQQESYRITDGSVEKYLGPMKHFAEELLERDQVGVATGLAWTAVGGDILFIEALAVKGKGKLVLTGQLGDVMKESAQAALTYARAHADEQNIPSDYFETHDIHIHVPAGAIPKDGPSAGITMTSAIISMITGRPVKRNVAMTGEVTLRGDVLPIGGLKEKVLAARAAKITTVIMPKLNERDLIDVPEPIKRDMQFYFVEHVEEVLKIALLDRAAAEQKTTERVGRESKPLAEPEPAPPVTDQVPVAQPG